MAEYTLILGDCLEKMGELEANSVDTILTDPPYFLINDSGAGFMNKEWDGIIGLWKYLWKDKQFVTSVALFLSALQIEKSTGGGNTALKNVHTQIVEKRTQKNALCAETNSITRKKNKDSVPLLVITKRDLLDLLKGLLPKNTGMLDKFLNGVNESVLFVLPTILQQNEHKHIAQELVTTLRKANALEEVKITSTKIDVMRIKNTIEVMTGISSENLYTEEADGNVDFVASIVDVKKYNATTLSRTESNKIIRLITLLLYALSVTQKSRRMSDDIIENFFNVIFREALRVAKPGAMLMAFGGTRTVHRLACAIEDAGWIIKDRIVWCYGSGFPKSLDISKAIDKAAGAEREVVGFSKQQQQRTAAIGTASYGDYKWQTGDITAPATQEAKEWEGYGTALKPAQEQIVLAMKPLDGTFAENAQKWGVAGLWIDGGRVETNPMVDDSRLGGAGSWKTDKGAKNVYSGRFEGIDIASSQNGRFPANLIHDGSEEVLSIFPDSKGQQGNLLGHNSKRESPNGIFGKMSSAADHLKRKETETSAARFFYCAKASKEERNAGLSRVIKQPKAGASFRPNHHEKAQQGHTGLPYGRWNAVANNHPTVKPLSLMRYLARLTRTPKGGIVLDPFNGSGTTGMAAILEGRKYIGMDITPEYIEISKKRIEWAIEERDREEVERRNTAGNFVRTAKEAESGQMSIWD